MAAAASSDLTCREAGKRGGRPKGVPLSPKSADWAHAFLATMRQTGNVWRSAEAAGVTRQAAYGRRDRDEAFRAAWADAADEACDRLEDVGRRRAEESSDVLLIFFLKSLRPKIYRETIRQEHTGADGEAIKIEDVTHVRTEILGSLAGLADATGEGSSTLPADAIADSLSEARLAFLAQGEADPTDL